MTRDIAAEAVEDAANILQALSAAPSVFEQYRELRAMLEGLDKRLVIVVDDVDRLRPDEVLDIVRLVRLVGDFPNTLYLLAFDRRRVEECLGEGNAERGRAYLEKIVQVTHDVPTARQPDVTAMFVASLAPMLDALPAGRRANQYCNTLTRVWVWQMSVKEDTAHPALRAIGDCDALLQNYRIGQGCLRICLRRGPTAWRT